MKTGRKSVHPHVPGDNVRLRIFGSRTLRFTPMCLGTMPRFKALGRTIHGSPPCAWGQSQHFVSSRGMATRYSPSKFMTFRDVSPWRELRSPAHRANSMPEGMRRRCCRPPPFPRAYPGGGLLYGRGISRPSVRPSSDSGPPAILSALVPESARPYKTSSMSGSIRSNNR